MKPKSILDKVVKPIRRTGIPVFSRLGDDLPDVLVLDPSRGVFCVEIISEDPSISRSDLSATAKSVNLKREIPEIGQLPRQNVSLSISAKDIQDPSKEVSPDWLSEFPEVNFDSSGFGSIANRLNPTMAFEKTGWSGFVDDFKSEREASRIRLDAAQQQIAVEAIKDVRVLSGPAGSGKSLVLAARAKYLATMHPDWNIQILCYNRILSAYLKGLLSGFPTVKVQTFGRWTSENGYRLGLKEEPADSRAVKKIRLGGIEPTIDALLIDEIQDFFPSWIFLALLHLRDHRGGALLVGDKQQQLYRDADLPSALLNRTVEYSKLEVPYRSTKQILDVVSALDPEQEIPGNGFAPAGTEVDLIWSSSDPSVKAEIIEFLTTEHLEDGISWGEMAVLVASKYAIGPIAGKLRDLEIPCEPIWSNSDDFERDMASNTLKIMTMNSAKGLEFSSVFLVGLDEIKLPSEGKDFTERSFLQNRARLNLVGPTRASDSLHILYSRENAYIQRLRAVVSPSNYFRWPDDFEIGK